MSPIIPEITLRFNSAAEELRRQLNENQLRVKERVGDRWNQVCASLDVIEDTSLAMEAFTQDGMIRSIESHEGIYYLALYGLFQSMYVQQDAVKHLSDCFGIRLRFRDHIYIDRVRRLRNRAVGHPTQSENRTNPECGDLYTFINRGIMMHDSFEIESVHSGGGTREVIFVPELIAGQRREVTRLIGKITAAITANSEAQN